MASTLLIRGGTLVLPDRLVPRVNLLCRDGLIADLHATDDTPADDVLDAWGCYLAPGFVDIHVHGGGGGDYMDATLESVRTANRCHLRHGTTTIFPTTTTGTPQQIHAMIQTCIAARDAWTPADGARIAGVHFYGPYFAPEKCGCHAVSGRRDPDPAEYLAALETGIVKVATCAAELPGAEDFYRAAAARRCLVTCGHSNASWQEMRRAYEAGMRHVDHFWCAMSSVASLRSRFGTPMQASMEQFVLGHEEMSTEVIADGYHLAPELLTFAWRMKGSGKLCLVTDSSRSLDMPPGEYRFGPEDGAWFTHDGHVGRVGDSLASSAQGMDHMVRHFAGVTGAPLHEVIRMATLTPAQLTGIDAEVGSMAPGKRADVVILTADLQVRDVCLGGAPVVHK